MAGVHVYEIGFSAFFLAPFAKALRQLYLCFHDKMAFNLWMHFCF